LFEGSILFKFAQVVLVAFLVIGALASASYAQEDISVYEKEYSAAKQAILEGHVKDGITRMAALVQKVDAVKEPNNYWILSANLAEFLYQLESYPEESQVLSSLLSTKISNSNPAFLQNMQLYVGRNLAYAGHADEAEKILRKLTGDDARWVHSPPQRAAARMLSTIELDRGNISQAAIWIRRAVVGAMRPVR
jgi:hypothetical protein